MLDNGLDKNYDRDVIELVNDRGLEVDISNLNFSSRTYGYLRGLGINNFYDLLRLRDNELEIIKDNFTSIYGEISDCVHACGYIFKDEDLVLLKDGIDNYSTDIECFNLSDNLNDCFRKHNINTVRDLIMCDKEVFSDIVNSEFLVKRVKNAVHARGCFFVFDNSDIIKFRNNNIRKAINSFVSEYNGFTDKVNSKVDSKIKRRIIGLY